MIIQNTKNMKDESNRTQNEKGDKKMFIVILKIIAIIAVIRFVGGAIEIVMKNLFLEIESRRYDNDPQRKQKIEEMRKRIEENVFVWFTCNFNSASYVWLQQDL